MAPPADDTSRLQPAVNAGLARAQANITGVLGMPVELTGTEIRVQPVLGTSDPETNDTSEVVAIYLYFRGDARGHCLLCLDLHTSAWLAAGLLGLPQDSVRDDWVRHPDPMAASALTEFGNITVSGFLNGLADHCGLAITPTPPAMTVDIMAAAVNFVLATLSMSTDTALTICAHFVFPGQACVRGTLLLLPETDSLQTLYHAASRRERP